MQVGHDQQTSTNCKSRLWFGLDKQLSTLVLKFSFIFSNQQRLRAGGILIPNLHKALLVVRHLMRPVLTFILSFIFGLSYGQDFSYPTINLMGQRINDFVPNGWTILDSAKGDLNKDGMDDAVIILQHKDNVTLIKSEDTIITQPRILLVLFKTHSDKLFHLIESSNTFILSHDNPIMDDPFQGLTIEKGVLKLNFHLFYSAGGWNTTSSNYKFRFNGKEFQLIGADLSNINRLTLDYEDFSFNFLAKSRSFTKGNEDNGIKKTTLKRIAISKRMTLKSFTEPYSWMIESDVYL